MPTLAEKWFEEGHQIGLEKGKQIGWQEGESEGLRKGLLEAIKIGLQLKFGNSGIAFFESVKGISDIETLKQIKDKIIDAKDLDELKALIKSDS